MAHFAEFPSAQTLNQSLARKVADSLRQGIEARGRASLVVSGGRTPEGFFALLAQQPLAWEKVVITLADERWVAPEDALSNERLVRRALLVGPAAAATFIGLKNGAATPEEGVAASEAALALFPWPADVVMLGMGADGHTASLFPGAANLPAALSLDAGQLCFAMTPVTAPLARITLSLPALLNSRHIYLHLVGEAKRELYERAAQGNDVNEMPVRAILNQQHTPVDVCWTV